MIGFYLSLIDTEEDKSIFETVYQKYRKVMMLEAKKYLDHTLAEDAMHSAFVKIADNIRCVVDPDSDMTRSFVIIVTRNTAIDMLRKLGRERELQGNLGEEQSYELSGDSPLERLPKIYRDALVLRYKYNYTAAQTAKLLGISQNAAYKRIERAKEELKKLLKEEETQ